MSKPNGNGFAADFAKLMDAWNAMERLVKQKHPELTEEEQYQLTSRAMSARFGLGGEP